MKNILIAYLALGLVLVFVGQTPYSLSEALKIKKVIKELKKLKKYGYLLAATKKKLYAVPFPMPLPVFVKRQHIYTQVPVIPRYVQHPPAYGAPAHSTDSASSYELMSGSYAPEIRVPSSSAAYAKAYSSSSSSPSYSSSASSSSSSRKKHSASDFASQLGPSGKYLSQIASLLGQASPMLGSSASSANRDLLSKLLSGQARVLPPTALLSAIKSPSSASKQYEQQESHKYQDQDQQQDNDSKSGGSGGGGGSSSSSSSSSSNAVTYDDSNVSTTSKPAQDASDTKPSASEMYKSHMRYGHSPMRAMYGAYMSPYHFPPALMGPMMSPMAALAAASRAQAMSHRMPMLRGHLGAVGGGDMTSPMDPYDGANQIDTSSHDPQEMSASQEHEATSREYPGAYAALLRQRQLQHQLQLQQSQPEHVMLALQKAQRSQLLARQQNAIKLALLREQEEAARLAESRQILVRAHQLGLPMVTNEQVNALKQFRSYAI